MSERMGQPEVLLTPGEVADIFRVDPKTVAGWARAGKLARSRRSAGTADTGSPTCWRSSSAAPGCPISVRAEASGRTRRRRGWSVPGTGVDHPFVVVPPLSVGWAVVSDTNRPGDVPPDLPPEYVEAYRRGYQRAYGEPAGAEGTRLAEPPEPDATERTQVIGPLFADEAVPPGAEPTRTLGSLDRALLAPPEDDHADHDEYDAEPAERPAWLVPAILGGLMLLLLVGAFGFGKLFSSSMSGGGSAADETPDGVVMNEDGSTSSDGPGRKPEGETFTGSTQTVAVGGATATCQAPSGVDAAGHQIRYEPRNVYDGDLTTAWRCDGDGVGRSSPSRCRRAPGSARSGWCPATRRPTRAAARTATRRTTGSPRSAGPSTAGSSSSRPWTGPRPSATCRASGCRW